MTDQQSLAEIRNSYRPYDTLPAFDEGFAAYQAGTHTRCPYDNSPNPRDAVNGQAWDRGANAAMRHQRHLDGIAAA